MQKVEGAPDEAEAAALLPLRLQHVRQRCQPQSHGCAGEGLQVQDDQLYTAVCF